MNTTSRDAFEDIELASVDELRALQFSRLQKSIEHTFENVLPYRQKCEAHGVSPSDLKSLEDLARFPYTEKEDLRKAYPYGLFAVPMDRLARIHASSGTTGRPTVVGYTRNDIDTWAKVCARSIYAGGGRPGDRIHVAYGYGLFTGGLGAHYGAERLGAMVIPMSGGQTPKQVQLIQDLQPDIIMCTPSYMLNIADEFAKQGLDPVRSSLRAGIFGAEPWSESMRREIEKRCGLDAVDIYGLSEVIGPGVGSECIESKDGPVIWEDHFYPEIIDPNTGAVLPDGETGELVFTSLTKEAMPIIRYRTRDLTSLQPGTSRTMRRIGRITGRSDDMLIIRGVNVFPSQVEEQILKDPALAPHYQLRVSRERNMDCLTILVERGEDTAGRGDDALGAALRGRVKDFIGISSKVEIHAPGGMPRSEGKAVRVIDERAGTDGAS